MMVRLQRLFSGAQLWVLAVVGAVLIGSLVLGAQPRALVLVALAAVVGLVILLRRPATGPVVLILAALLLRKEFGTGTAVTLNLVALLIPALVVLWFVEMVLSHQVSLVPSRVNRPLWLFLLAGLVSVLVGNALWDPAAPRSDNLILVQLAQWAIFAFSAGAFWLMANRISNAAMLQRSTFVFLALAVDAARESVELEGALVLVPDAELLRPPLELVDFFEVDREDVPRLLFWNRSVLQHRSPPEALSSRAKVDLVDQRSKQSSLVVRPRQESMPRLLPGRRASPATT